MTDKITDEGTRQDRWARFRFSVVGPLLSDPPEGGELRERLQELSQKQWKHPITGKRVSFAFSTIERWFYQACKENNPVRALRTKRRVDAGKARQLSSGLKRALQEQYKEYPGWSCQLHVDNLASLLRLSPELGEMPSYSTVLRYMKSNSLRRHRKSKKRDTAGAQLAAQRLEDYEVRGYEMDHVSALWHLDFHHCSRSLIGRDGKWHKPLLLSIIDDRSRLICHAQWYGDETAESLVHGFTQALQKRGLPRSLMTDNGSAMISAEFTQGLERIGILHKPTLPYSPHQNGKQETWWSQVEGRLMAMLEGEPNLTIDLLNQATIVWIESDYHKTVHSETKETPLERYLKGPDVRRPCPDGKTLREAFCMQATRKQRRSDGTFTLEGKRFEVPSAYRHLEYIHVRYARWDLSTVLMTDPHENTVIGTLYPQDKSANASGIRRALHKPETPVSMTQPKPGLAPLLKELLAEYAATGLPLPYIPKKGDFE
jgi:putative transposase